MDSKFVTRRIGGTEQDLDLRYATAVGVEGADEVDVIAPAAEAAEASAAKAGSALATTVTQAAAGNTHADILSGNPHVVTKTNVGLGSVTDVDHAGALSTHAGLTNPHGAEPVGAAAAAVTAHESDATNSHLSAAEKTGLVEGNETTLHSHAAGASGAVEVFEVVVSSLAGDSWTLPAGWSAAKLGASVLDITHNRAKQAVLMQVVDDLVSSGYKKTWPGGDPSGPIMYVADVNDTDVRIAGLAVLADSFKIQFVFPL